MSTPEGSTYHIQIHLDMKICVTHNIVFLRLAGLLIAVCDSQHAQKHINIKNIKVIAKKIYKKMSKVGISRKLRNSHIFDHIHALASKTYIFIPPFSISSNSAC